MQGLGYVVAISCQQRLFLNGYRGRVDEHVSSRKESSWKQLSCGTGTKGEPIYQWAFIPFGLPSEDGMRKGLLVRRSLKDPTDLADYFTYARSRTRLQQLVHIAGLSKSVLNSPSRRRAWTNMKFAIGMRGTVTSLSRCSRMRSHALFASKGIHLVKKNADSDSVDGT